MALLSFRKLSIGKMLFRYIKIIVFALVLFSFPVFGQTAHYERETKIFSDALTKYFKQSIPQKKACYFIVPNAGCPGCSKWALKFISQGDLSSIIPIVSVNFQNQLVNYGIDMENILIDSENIFSRLDLHTQSTTLIATNNEKLFQ
jgi:hypothetical protein